MIGLVTAIVMAQSFYDLDLSDVRSIHTPSVNSKGVPMSETCAEWTAARKMNGRKKAQLEAWVVGIITGYNLYHPKSQDDKLDLLNGNNWGKESQTFFSVLDQRCLNAPSQAFPTITVDLVEEWRKR